MASHMTRYERIEPCEHGWMVEHWFNVDGSPIRIWQQGLSKQGCPGGSRTVLEPTEIRWCANHDRAPALDRTIWTGDEVEYRCTFYEPERPCQIVSALLVIPE